MKPEIKPVFPIQEKETKEIFCNCHGSLRVSDTSGYRCLNCGRRLK